MDSYQGYSSDHRFLDKRKCLVYSVAKWILFFFVLLNVITSSTATFYRDCETNAGVFKACSPPTEPILVAETPTFQIDPPDTTCGTNGDETYIRLGDVLQQETCAQGVHSPDKMADSEGTTTWWQSTTWPVGQYDIADPKYPVTIMFSLNKKYRMSENIVITWNSGRPQNMVIEKSPDYGQTWEPLQFYARNCPTSYPTAASSFSQQPTAVICTEQYSQDSGNPVEGMQVIFPGSSARLDNLPGNYNELLESTNMLSFMIFTDIRFKLIYPATDAQEYTQSPINFKSYYYAISNIMMVGSCFCNLHASGCISDAGTGETVCECSHNTEGKDCERCKPLYNNKPWTSGSFTPFSSGTANACEMCDCYDHADSCTYNETLGYGSCNACRDNTGGPRCSECVDGFYQNLNMTVALNFPDICLPCDCENIGLADPTNNLCLKNRQESNVGQCMCKPQVTGRRCDKCEEEFYGFLIPETIGTCKPCDCNQLGTVDQQKLCDQVDGQCPCKPSTGGRQCERCKDGYFQFPDVPSKECSACLCDPGGSSTLMCDQVGMCTCITHLSGTKCRSVDPNFYIPALDEYLLQPVTGSCTIGADLWTAARPFDGGKFATCTPDSNVEFDATTGGNYQFDISWPYYSGIRYTLDDATDWTGATLSVTSEGNTGIDVTKYTKDGQTPPADCPIADGNVLTLSPVFTPGVAVVWFSDGDTVELDLRCIYKFTLTIPAQTNGTTILIDSLVLLPALSHPSGAAFRSLTEHNAAATYLDCAKEEAALATRSAAISTSTCNGLLWSVAAEVAKEGKPCECDPVGTDESTCGTGVCTCSAHGGQCACKPGVGGRTCDACLPGFYGMTATGCKACDCIAGGSLNGACDNQGQCACLPNVAKLGETDSTGSASGRQCSACLSDFFGFGTETGCSSCGCSVDGSTGSQCSADGNCTCKDTIGGLQCDVCAQGYFSLSPTGCQTCDCNPDGSTTAACNPTTGDCQCKDNVDGPKCETCKTGFFNIASYNPKGCQPCFCFNKGDSCASSDGFQEHQITSATLDGWTTEPGGLKVAPTEYIGDKSNSYGQLFSLEINLVGDEGDLSGLDLVTLEGNGNSITYRHTSPITAGVNTISVRLFPENWQLSDTSNPDAATLYRILLDITKVAIQTTIGGAEKTVMSVSLVTAMAAEGVTVATGAGFVEMCTCNSATNTAGMSCERCATGFQLANPGAADVRFETCTACSCNSKTEGQRECDQVTGVCLNCRNGTMGDQCESCAANVEGAECDTCTGGFWGISLDGCQECGCASPGTTPAALCNKASGQCDCVPNVTGRQCDVCEPNFHTLTAAGCSECDGCYKLVMDEADKLQVMLTSLADMLVTLKANDYTTSLGPYVTRVTDANAALSTLLSFLQNVNQEEATVGSRIAQFNASIDALTSKLDTVENTDQVEIAGQLQVTSASLADASLQRTTTIENLNKISTDLQPLAILSSSLTTLRQELVDVETSLNSLSTNGQAAVDTILATVTEIETLAQEAVTTSQADLQRAQELITAHQTTSQEIVKLENVDRTMETLSTSGISEAQRIESKGLTVYNTTLTLQTEQSEIGTLSVDFTQMNASVQADLLSVEGIRASAEVGLQAVRTKRQTIDQALSESAQQSINTNNIISQVDALTQRVTAAEVLAEDANLNSVQVFTDAEAMLDVMRNFATKAQEVENNVNIELAKADALISQSTLISTQATTMMTAMSSAQQSASLGKQNALNAKTTMEAIDAELVPILASANDLQSRDTADLATFQAKVAEPVNIETNSVDPANVKCQTLQGDIQSINSIVGAASTQAGSLKDEIQLTQTEASQILNTVTNLLTLDPQRIQDLRNQVTQLQGMVDVAAMTAALTQIKFDFDSQTQWLNDLMAKKTRLMQELQAIRTAHQLITI